ncbi:MAG: PIN domain-containing protein [Nanoarchaeota archaeon]|mgnify:CR=1
MKIVLDNNVLFSLMNPSSISSYLFSSIKTEFFSPEFVKLEFEKHREECLAKSRLSEQEFKMRLLEVEEKIIFLKFSQYENFIMETLQVLEDLNDADFLALALSINASIWSNDPHLKKQLLVKVFLTSDIIKFLLEGKI